MADPTSAEIIAQWKAWIHLLEETRKYGHVNAENFLNLMDTAEQLLEGDWGDEVENAGHALRAALSGMLSDAMAAAMQRPFLRQYCKSVIGRSDLTDDQEMLDEIYDYFHANSITPHMSQYHTFYEIHGQTPGAIIETGFMFADREMLTQRADLVAQGIAEGIVCFIENEVP